MINILNPALFDKFSNNSKIDLKSTANQIKTLILQTKASENISIAFGSFNALHYYKTKKPAKPIILSQELWESLTIREKCLAAYLQDLANGNFHENLINCSRETRELKNLLEPAFDVNHFNMQLDKFKITLPSNGKYNLTPVDLYCNYMLFTGIEPFQIDKDVMSNCHEAEFSDIYIDNINMFHFLIKRPHLITQKSKETQIITVPDFEEGEKYLNKYWPGLTDPIGLRNFDFYAKLTQPNVSVEEVLSDKDNLYIIMHSIDLEIIFGGINAFFKFIACLSRKHFNSHINFILTDQSSGLDGAYYQTNREKHPLCPKKSRLNIDIQLFNPWTNNKILISKSSTLIAYNAKAAYILKSISTSISIKKAYYFIQEDESIFTSNNSFNAAMKESYYLDFEKIVNSNYLLQFMKKNYPEAFADDNKIKVFQHQLLSPSESIHFDQKKLQIIVYFRPESHAERNCPEIVLASLKSWVQNYYNDSSEKVNIFGLGSFSEHRIDLGKNIKFNIIPKLSFEDYMSIMNDSAAGISLMNAPHPSVVPFEMAEFGVRCVTNTYQNRRKENLRKESPFIYPSTLDPDDIAFQLNEALKDFKNDSRQKRVLSLKYCMTTREKWEIELNKLVEKLGMD